MDKLDQIEKELEDLGKEYKDLSDKIARKQKLWEKLKKDSNTKHFDDIEWLINNPGSPGQYEAMRKWIENNLGGDFKGVHASGYSSDINQQAFCFNLSFEGERKPEFDKNIKKFLSCALKYMKPCFQDAVAFQIGTGQYSGIHYLCYDPKIEKWFTVRMQYSRVKDRVEYEDFDEALDDAWIIALNIDD